MTMSHKLLCRSLLAGVSIVSLSIGHARAQAVDYGSFEEMFGEPVTTSVTGAPQRASEVPASITIITQDDIRRSGADNIPDILQFVPGIDMRRESFGQADVAIRGYDQPFNPRLLVLINGRQVYMDDYGYVAWNALPVTLSEIRQIEVVKGPQSALFGFNAASGVINIITYDPLLDSTNTATLRGGTQALGEGEGVTTVHLGKTFGARLSVGGYTANDFTKPTGTDYPDPRNGHLNADLRWQVMPKIELRAEAGLVDNRNTIFAAPGLFEPGENRVTDERVGGAAQTGIGLIDLDLYRNEARNQYQIASPFTVTNVVRVVKLSDLFKAGPSNTFRVGVEYRNNLGTSPQLFDGTISYDDYAANAMWNWNISPKVTLVNAGRIDHAVLHSDAYVIPVAGRSSSVYNNTTITEPSFNSGVVYTVTQKDTVHLTAARGLQMPSLLDLGVQLPLGSTIAVGSPTQSPTAVWNLDLGYARDLQTIDSNVTVDTFLQRNTNLIGGIVGGRAPSQGNAITTIDTNVGSSNEAGIELGIKGKSSNGFRWSANYQFYAISEDITSISEVNASSRLAGSTPESEVMLGAGYSVARWEFDLNGRWQTGFNDYKAPSAIPIEVGDYVTLAGRIGYNITPHITVAGSAEQFNLAKIQESAGLLVARRFIASITIHL